MRQNRRPRPFLRLAALTVAAAAGGLVWAMPASAAQGTRPCPSYKYCFYENIDYNQTPGWRLSYLRTTLQGNFELPPSPARPVDIHDELSSVINNTSRALCLYNKSRVPLKNPAVFRVDAFTAQRNLHENDRGDRVDYWKVVEQKDSCPKK